MLQKNKLRNPLTFHANADSGAKWEKSNAKYLTIYFSFFLFRDLFHTFRDKYVERMELSIANEGRYFEKALTKKTDWELDDNDE